MHPEEMLAYNLSPSFKTDGAGMNERRADAQLHPRVGEDGVLLAVHHDGGIPLQCPGGGHIRAQRRMLEYVQNIQRQERPHGVETLLH